MGSDADPVGSGTFTWIRNSLKIVTGSRINHSGCTTLFWRCNIDFSLEFLVLCLTWCTWWSLCCASSWRGSCRRSAGQRSDYSQLPGTWTASHLIQQQTVIIILILYPCQWRAKEFFGGAGGGGFTPTSPPEPLHTPLLFHVTTMLCRILPMLKTYLSEN